MTIRNLDALFAPRAVALIGASNRERSVGAVLAANLMTTGFSGAVMTVNPREATIRSTINYKSVEDLPVTPDLAVIATPPSAVPGAIARLGARGCRAAVVVTAGFGEGERASGLALRQQMLDAARPHLLRIVGPNCLGFISPAQGLNASFAQLMPASGNLAFVTQSGAVATAMLDWAAGRGIGFSHMVSVGDMADVDFGDLLDYLALDPMTHAILLYVEAVANARKFMTAGRIAARTKPVIVVKAGRGESGAKAAVSHTGALAGSDVVYDAVFRRAGMLRVSELRDLFAAAETLSSGIRIAGDRLTVLTNGGGLGVIAADAVERAGGTLATLSPETIAKLDAVLPRTWSRANPVDIIGDATGERYAAALDALLADEAHNAVLIVNCPTAITDSLEAAEAVVARLGAGEGVAPVLTAWVGEPAAQPSRRLFASHRVPTYETPEEAVRAFMQLVDYRRNQDLLIETPPAFALTPAEQREKARAVVRAALDQERSLLSEAEAKAVINAYGIPTAPTFVAADAAEARRRAEEIAGPAVLKILSPDITHKSDVGGVRLDLRTPAEVEAAAVEMLAAVQAHLPGARLSGFTVQPMIRRAAAQELIAGISVDPTFGPVILFGHGGTATEVIGDRAIGLPPLNRVLARDLIRSTRVSRLLAGYRDRPPADLDALADILCRLSEIAIDLPEVAELDINPLLADAEGSLALDARIVVRQSTGDRLAIHPYPVELEKPIELLDGTRLLLRPIRPEDEPALIEMVRLSTADDRRLRFLAPLNDLSHTTASRLTQIDYDREMAFVAAKPGEGGLLGVSRLIADPDNIRAEFAVMVRSDLKGRGLGYRLMEEMIDHARRRGVRELVGEVLPENATMLNMAEELGFARSTLAAGVVRVSLDIGPKAAA